VAKCNDGSDLVAGEESKGAAQAEESKNSKGEGKSYGEDGYRYPQLEFPSTHEDLAAYNLGVKQRIEAKYASLIKNVHFYLSYLFLETGDYRNAVKHGELVLSNNERLTKKTRFTVM